MPYVEAKPKAIYVGMKCKPYHIKALVDIADYWDIPIYKMDFDECSELYELVTREYNP